MSNIIKPTIGRRVWYWPSAYDMGHNTDKPGSVIQANTPRSGQPCDAGVVYVHNDRMVNLSVTDHNGNIHVRTSVTLVQPDRDYNVNVEQGGFATWMDYQVEQAKKEDKDVAREGDTPTPPEDLAFDALLRAMDALATKGTGVIRMVHLGDISKTEVARAIPLEGEGMGFGWALNMLEAGHKVTRKGWNGKGMWLSLSGTEGTRPVHASNIWSKNVADYALTQPNECAEVQPCIVMKTATGQIQMGWLASQSDMLAKDWELVA